MSKKPLGFVDKTGIMVAGVLLALIVLWTGTFGPVLFTPGELRAKTTGKTIGGMKSHAQSEGACDICHPEPWSSQDMATRCIRCHANVNAEIRNKTGVHGLLLGRSNSLTCRGCHTEHVGEDGSLTVVDERAFPHDLTGYSLAGHAYTVKGPAFSCRDCHVKDVAHFDQATCWKCHSEIDEQYMAAHLAAFGSRCLLCHDGSGEADFNHNRFAFKLTGAHVNVPCLGCHSRQRTTQAYRSTPRDCYSCHAKNDVHRGTLGKRCGQCHNTTTWRGATFNHATLTGALADKECYSCHRKNDPHGGSLGTKCGQCHTTSSWGGATFSHRDIRGGTSTANCGSCHAKDDPHGGSFGRQCGQCHSTTSWGGVSLTHRGFPASHGGARGCTTCHPNGSSTYTCYGCHAHSPSNIQSEHDGRSPSSLANCVRCHSGGGGEDHEGREGHSDHEGRRGHHEGDDD